jgi:hypothetical protein
MTEPEENPVEQPKPVEPPKEPTPTPRERTVIITRPEYDTLGADLEKIHKKRN